MGVDTVEYAGWPNNLRLSNDVAELIVTLDVGPRVISYRLRDGKNVLKEIPGQLGTAGEPEWVARGGHRLWTAPEDLTRTYSPDNGPVAHTVLADGVVRITQPPETRYGIQKEIDLKLDETSSRVTLTHRIRAVGSDAVELAPWALTILDAGGVEVIPLPPKRPHPGPPSNARSAADYAPNQTLVLWPFTDLADPRFTWGSQFILLRQDATRGSTKIGLAHRLGWVGYLNRGVLFVKRFAAPDGDATYPDGGCNFESFTNADLLEMETLGPVVRLSPNEAAEHIEQWELFAGVADVQAEGDVAAHVLPSIGAPVG